MQCDHGHGCDHDDHQHDRDDRGDRDDSCLLVRGSACTQSEEGECEEHMERQPSPSPAEGYRYTDVEVFWKEAVSASAEIDAHEGIDRATASVLAALVHAA